MNWLSLDGVIYILITITVGLHHFKCSLLLPDMLQRVFHTLLFNSYIQTVLGQCFVLSADVSAAVNILIILVYFT